MIARLDHAIVDRELLGLAGWQRRGDTLRCGYRFADFAAAFAFMQQVASVAEELQHHPDWRNCYADVELSLTTHDVGGLSQLDIALAHRVAVLAEAAGAVVSEPRPADPR